MRKFKIRNFREYKKKQIAVSVILIFSAMFLCLEHGICQNSGNSVLTVTPQAMTNTSVVAGLIQNLTGKDDQAASRAADQLGDMSIEARDAVPSLIETLKDQQRSVVVGSSAARALARIWPYEKGTINALVDALKDSRPPVRIAVVNAAGSIQPVRKEVFDAFLDMLKSSSESDGIKMNVEDKLGEMWPYDKKAVLRALYGALKDRSPYVQKEAIHVFGQMGPEAKILLPIIQEARKDPSLVPDIDEAVQKINTPAHLAKPDPGVVDLYGGINFKYMVFMHLKTEGDRLTGDYNYGNPNDYLLVHGNMNEFDEFDMDGNYEGTMHFTKVYGLYKGEWQNANKTKVYPFFAVPQKNIFSTSYDLFREQYTVQVVGSIKNMADMQSLEITRNGQSFTGNHKKNGRFLALVGRIQSSGLVSLREVDAQKKVIGSFTGKITNRGSFYGEYQDFSSMSSCPFFFVVSN